MTRAAGGTKHAARAFAASVPLVDVLEIRNRLDRLAHAPPPEAGLLDRAARLVGGGRNALLRALDLTHLEALDRDLDAAGVHTLADARVLARLSRARRGEAAAVARALHKRLRRASGRYLRALDLCERVWRTDGGISSAVVDRLERGYRMFARAAKAAAAFERPADAKGDPYELLPRGESAPPPHDPRVAAAQFFADRAESNPLDLVRKRRDLDVAYEMLLSLDPEPEHERTRALRARVATARAEMRATPAGPEDAAAAVAHALARRDGAGAWRGLMEIYRSAVQGGDAEVAAASRRALDGLSPGVRGGEAPAERARAALFLEAAGPGPIAVLAARTDPARPPPDDAAGAELARVAFNLAQERFQVFELAIGVGRFFDVEAAEGEEVVLPEAAGAGPGAPRRRVPYPTPDMAIDLARGPQDAPNFVISDPRLVLHDLAQGRQLARAYFEATVPEPMRRRVRRGTVRAYVCDASGSMRGARARFRDAVLLAELNNLCVKAARGREFEPLYYSFFTDAPTDLARINSPAEARALIEKLFRSSPAAGRTNITYAVEAAFHAIRQARGIDPDLARATVVLVTDGEDRVDLEAIRAARAPMGDIELILSLIQLGEENPDLRSLAVEQRNAGRRAFYYHLTDDEVRSSRTDFDSGVRTILPRRAEVDLEPDDPEVRKAIEALLAIARTRREGAAPAGPSPASRFDAVFPVAVPAAAAVGDDPERLRVLDLLGAVAEACALAPATARAGEAVVLIEYLLGRYGVPVPRYLKLVGGPEPSLREAVRRIRIVAAGLEER